MGIAAGLLCCYVMAKNNRDSSSLYFLDYAAKDAAVIGFLTSGLLGPGLYVAGQKILNNNLLKEPRVHDPNTFVEREMRRIDQQEDRGPPKGYDRARGRRIDRRAPSEPYAWKAKGYSNPHGEDSYKDSEDPWDNIKDLAVIDSSPSID